MPWKGDKPHVGKDAELPNTSDGSKPGKSFEDELQPLLRAISSICLRLPDTRTFRAGRSTNLITGKQPSDWMALYHLKRPGLNQPLIVYWEAKSQTDVENKPVSYKLKKYITGVKPHQIGWSVIVKEHFDPRIRYFYVIGNRNTHGGHYACVFEGSYLARLKDEGVSSMKWRDMEKQAICVLEKGRGDYDTPENRKKLLDYLGIPAEDIIPIESPGL